MRYSIFFTAVLAALLSLSTGLLVACGGSGSEPVGCIDNGDCDEGFACVSDACSEVECLDSSGCSQGEYCAENYVCRTGCLEDADCIAGEVCDTETRECETYGCRDTQLDCAYGEYCDETTGECYPDNRDHCAECSFFEANACGNDGQCFQFSATDLTGYCLMECDESDEEACPRGFECYDPTGGNGQTYCSAWCPKIEDYL